MITSAEGISLGLITAELVINALKHAFPGGRKGKIVVSYDLTDVGWTLSVKDDGIGINPNVPHKEGLGTSIVHSLSRQLHATVRIDTTPEGTTVSIIKGAPLNSPPIAG